MSGHDRNWRRRAACLTADPELFFPIGTVGPALRQVEEAKQVCRGCPVRTACADWALHHHADHGVWGGLDEGERRYLRRRGGALRTTGVLPPTTQPSERVGGPRT